MHKQVIHKQASSADSPSAGKRQPPAAPPHSREQFEQALWLILTGPQAAELTSRQIVESILAAHDQAVAAASRRAVLDAALGLMDATPAPASTQPRATVHWLGTDLRTGCGIDAANRPPGFATATRWLVTCHRPGCTTTPVNPKGTPS